MWTQFMDMHSGGGQKLKWAYIYIEAPEKEAEIIFQNRLGRNPHRVTCTCCGSDYSITEDKTLKRATAYERGCQWVKVAGEDGGGHYVEKPSKGYAWHEYKTLDEYLKQDDVLFIYKKDIKPEELEGELRAEGYCWAGEDD